jgi:hypothetical protein
MEHLVVMNKSLGMIPKILVGAKSIDAVWQMSKTAPWGKIKKGDAVYFKNAGEPVIAKADVAEVLQVEDLDDTKVGIILNRYYSEMGIAEQDIPKFYSSWRDKKYCTLIWLENAEEIEPFEVSKTWQAVFSAWISVEDINDIRR